MTLAEYDKTETII